LIDLTPSGSVSLTGAAVVSVLALGAGFSVGAAKQGPDWARRTIRKGGAVAGLVAAVGVGVMAFFRPFWVGVAYLYLALVVWLLSRTVSRRLELIGPVQVDPVYAEMVVRRTRTGLLALAVLLGLIAVLSRGSVVSAVVGGVALVLGGASAALFIRRRPTKAAITPDQSV